MLLARADATPAEVLTRVVGLQAQAARPPYVGMWTRLARFARSDLHDAIVDKRIVKATLMRSTLHLLTAEDYLAFRATLQPVLTNALQEILEQRGANVDVERLVKATRPFIHAAPRSFAELTEFLTRLEPDADPGAMRYSVRTRLPLIQVPTDSTWTFPGNPKFALAEDWLATRIPDRTSRLSELVKRYLAAFGPATVKDMETWSYLPDLAAVFETLRSDLVVYSEERRREVFDLPDATLEPEDSPAPVRFIPEFDNLVMAHQDRTRFVPKSVRKAVYLPGLRVAATVLIDGYVGATWTTARVKNAATLSITPFTPPNARLRNELEQEADRLLRFAEPDASTYEVKIDA